VFGTKYQISFGHPTVIIIQLLTAAHSIFAIHFQYPPGFGTEGQKTRKFQKFFYSLVTPSFITIPQLVKQHSPLLSTSGSTGVRTEVSKSFRFTPSLSSSIVKRHIHCHLTQHPQGVRHRRSKFISYSIIIIVNPISLKRASSILPSTPAIQQGVGAQKIFNIPLVTPPLSIIRVVKRHSTLLSTSEPQGVPWNQRSDSR